MATEIEWTDETWNPVTGCTKVSPGCKFCYAERVAKRYWGTRKFTDVQIHADRLDAPLRWRRPRRVFVNSMSDLFHEAVPDEFVLRIYQTMGAAHQHVYQILTKRAERMAAVLSRITPILRAEGRSDPATWRHVHLGVSVEDQARADERIPLLLQTPTAVRFLSVEPLLGQVDLRAVDPGKWRCVRHVGVGCPAYGLDGALHGIYWVICGGESGGSPERALVTRCNRQCQRECTGWHPKPEALAWVRALRDQSVAGGVPFFFKQWGGPSPKAGGRMLDEQEWSEYPA